MDFWEVIQEAINKAGGCEPLGNTVGIDKTTISRFKNGESGLTIPKLNKIINAAGYVIVPANHIQDQDIALGALARLLERNNRNQNKLVIN